jgi:hypothetical protein
MTTPVAASNEHEPCDITADGWCATHSTSAGPKYCAQPRCTYSEGCNAPAREVAS